MTSPFDLSGHRILITGASSGIGRATAIAASRLGAITILVGRNRERLEATLESLENSGHSIEPRELLDLDGIPDWMKSVASQCGPLSGMVHCAGIEELAPIRYVSLDRFRQMQDVNVTAGLMLLKGFRQKGVCVAGSSVVLVSSVASLVGQPGHTGYCATKGALTALARAAAVELATEGIRVNCIAPGWVEDTAMTEAAGRRMPSEQIAAIGAMHPFGVGKPDDVANGITFLLSGAARWITGSTLVVDGGYSAQ